VYNNKVIMTYEWKKEKGVYKYLTEQFTGKFECESNKEIEPKLLDILFTKLQAIGTTEGVTEYKDQKIYYKFTSKDLWEEDKGEVNKLNK